MVITKTVGELFNSIANRIRLLTALLLASGCSAVWGGQSVRLAWDPSPDTSVVGYVVHYGTASSAYTSALDVGNNSAAVLPGLQPGMTYYFVVTAYNSARQESTPSNEVIYQVPVFPVTTGPSLRMSLGTQPNDPARFQFLGEPDQGYDLQATEDFKTWTTLWHSQPQKTSQLLECSDTGRAESGMRFYRLVVY